MFVLLIAFAAGAASGYWFRDRQQAERLETAVADARQEVRDATLSAIDRARRAGGGLAAGAEAAAESTRAALRQLVGSERN
jgi:hypothetical protein